MGPQITLKIMQYLSLTDNTILSSTCHFFYTCYKNLWLNKTNFKHMDLSTFSSVIFYLIKRLKLKNLNKKPKELLIKICLKFLKEKILIGF